MSSHHIVRDEQEPALLLWQPGQLSFEQAGQLLEWSPRVVVHQPALEEALAWGIKLDAICTTPDAMAAAVAAVEHQQPVDVLPLPEQDALQAILQWLRDRQQASLYLIADAAADYFLLLRQLEPLQQLAQIQVISQGWRYSYFKSGLVQKWLPRGSRLRLISFSEQPLLSGAKANAVIQNHLLQELVLEQSGMLQLKSDTSVAAPFWIGEEL
jgi:thiamine pyrophosphokinase